MCTLLFTLAPSWLLYENILFSLFWTDLSSFLLPSAQVIFVPPIQFFLAEKCRLLCLLLYPFMLRLLPEIILR